MLAHAGPHMEVVLSRKLGVAACWEGVSAGGHGPDAEEKVHATGIVWVSRCKRNCCFK